MVIAIIDSAGHLVLQYQLDAAQVAQAGLAAFDVTSRLHAVAQ